MGKKLDLKSGERFGKLVVIEYVGKNRHRKCMWRCKCDCGAEKTVLAVGLTRGTTTSCGCHQRSGLARRHGMAGTQVYIAWKNMRQRCLNPNHPQWEDWGGRGISFCQKWETFEGFFEDMGSPKDGETLERLDNSKGYSKDNCEWRSHLAQNNNRRSNRVIENEGKRLTITQWSREREINHSTLNQRLRRGWSEEEALSSEKSHNRKPNVVEFNGRSMTESAWARELGISQTALNARLRKGWPLEKALTPKKFHRFSPD